MGDGAGGAHEIIHVDRPAGRILEGRDALGRDHEESTQRWVLHVWRLALRHLHSHDACGPHVHALIILGALERAG